MKEQQSPKAQGNQQPAEELRGDSPGGGLWRGTVVVECNYCHGIGDDEHGNACIFCDGHGQVDERDGDEPSDFDDDELQAPIQEEP